MDLPRLMFIDEECGNLKIVVDGGQLTRGNNRKKKPEVSQAYSVHSLANAINKD